MSELMTVEKLIHALNSMPKDLVVKVATENDAEKVVYTGLHPHVDIMLGSKKNNVDPFVFLQFPPEIYDPRAPQVQGAEINVSKSERKRLNVQQGKPMMGGL